MSWLNHGSVARNLKFFSLSLRKAMEEGAPLDFVAHSFAVETCQGEEKQFSTLSTWELLNLRPATVLELSDRLYKDYGVSSSFLSDAMNKYTIQSTGKGVLEEHFRIEAPPQYMLATTRHYSWPKGAGQSSSYIWEETISNSFNANSHLRHWLRQCCWYTSRPCSSS